MKMHAILAVAATVRVWLPTFLLTKQEQQNERYRVQAPELVRHVTLAAHLVQSRSSSVEDLARAPEVLSCANH